MRKNKKTNDPNILIEKQKFYISEFEQEAAWLSFMHREGWKFVSTDSLHYRFERTEKDDWCYQMDYIESGVAEEDYLQMYNDYGWEFVSQCDHWCYFRKQRGEAEASETTLFGDRESKLELCKRVVHGQFLRILPFLLLMSCVINLLRLYHPAEHFGTFISVLCWLSLGIFILPMAIYLNQIHRINKLMKELKGTK